MAAPHSTGVDRGSADVGSESRPPADPALANARVAHYVHDSTAPANATAQSGISQRDHRMLLEKFNLVFSEQHQAVTSSVATQARPPSESGRPETANVSSAVEIANATRCIGAHFEESQSA
ncbi:Polynucleotide 5'-hydroxyl-kinase grc3 [Hypoxylon texense]